MLESGRILAFGAAALAAGIACFAGGCSAKGGSGTTPSKAAKAPAASPGTGPATSRRPETSPAKADRPVVVIETSLGMIRAELWADRAPETVANFLRYVDEKFYDGLIFHRVIPGFMIQGGGFSPEMRSKSTGPEITNEAAADLRNDRGTLAMARTGEINSATSQFFINLVDNDALNHTDNTPRGFGYCVFGKVVDGMDVVDRIAQAPTGNKGPYSNVPVEVIVIKTIRRAEPTDKP